MVRSFFESNDKDDFSNSNIPSLDNSLEENDNVETLDQFSDSISNFIDNPSWNNFGDVVDAGINAYSGEDMSTGNYEWNDQDDSYSTSDSFESDDS